MVGEENSVINMYLAIASSSFFFCSLVQESFVCKACVATDSAGQELRECETCEKLFCAGCRHVCHDPDCQVSNGKNAAQEKKARLLVEAKKSFCTPPLIMADDVKNVAVDY